MGKKVIKQNVLSGRNTVKSGPAGFRLCMVFFFGYTHRVDHVALRLFTFVAEEFRVGLIGFAIYVPIFHITKTGGL